MLKGTRLVKYKGDVLNKVFAGPDGSKQLQQAPRSISGVQMSQDFEARNATDSIFGFIITALV